MTAIGGGGAPGIGQAGRSSDGVGSILVSGGVVTATGGYGSSGIGGCYYPAVPVTISGGVVTATGGELGAGIGGGQCESADVTISGGVVTATGGYHGAGIGGGEGSYGVTYSAGTVRISGGIVSATAGEGAHGIGGGYLSDRGSVEITGGTVAAAGGEGGMDVGIVGPSGVAGSVVFGGGSILADMAKVKPAAKNAAGTAVWRVDVAVPDPDPARAVAVTGLDGYGVADIYPDANGDIHLWLPDGTYDFEVDGTPVHEEVDGSSVFIPLGVAVDGVDVGHGSGTTSRSTAPPSTKWWTARPSSSRSASPSTAWTSATARARTGLWTTRSASSSRAPASSPARTRSTASRSGSRPPTKSSSRTPASGPSRDSRSRRT